MELILLLSISLLFTDTKYIRNEKCIALILINSILVLTKLIVNTCIKLI